MCHVEEVGLRWPQGRQGRQGRPEVSGLLRQWAVTIVAGVLDVEDLEDLMAQAGTLADWVAAGPLVIGTMDELPGEWGALDEEGNDDGSHH